MNVFFDGTDVIDLCDVVNNGKIECSNLPEGYGSIQINVGLSDQISDDFTVSFLPPSIESFDCTVLDIYTINKACKVTGNNFGPIDVVNVDFISNDSESTANFELLSVINTHKEIEMLFNLNHFGGVFIFNIGTKSINTTVTPTDGTFLTSTITNTYTVSKIVFAFKNLFLNGKDVSMIVNGSCCHEYSVMKTEESIQKITIDNVDCVHEIQFDFESKYSKIRLVETIPVLWQEASNKFIGGTVGTIPMFTFATCLKNNLQIRIDSSIVNIVELSFYNVFVTMPLLMGEFSYELLLEKEVISTSPHKLNFYPPNVQSFDPSFVSCLYEFNVSFVGPYFGAAGMEAILLLYDSDTMELVSEYFGEVVRNDLVEFSLIGNDIEWCVNSKTFSSLLSINNVKSDYMFNVPFTNGVVYSPYTISFKDAIIIYVYMDSVVLQSFIFKVFNDTFELEIICYPNSENNEQNYKCTSEAILTAGEYQTNVVVDESTLNARNFFVYELSDHFVYLPPDTSINDVALKAYYGNQLVFSNYNSVFMVTDLTSTGVLINIFSNDKIGVEMYSLSIGSETFKNVLRIEIFSFDFEPKWALINESTDIVIKLELVEPEIIFNGDFTLLSSLCEIYDSSNGEIVCEYLSKDLGVFELYVETYFIETDITFIPEFCLGNIEVFSTDFLLIDLPIVNQQLEFNINFTGSSEYNSLPSMLQVELISSANTNYTSCKLKNNAYQCVVLINSSNSISVVYNSVVLGVIEPYDLPIIYNCDIYSFSNLYLPSISCLCVSCGRITNLFLQNNKNLKQSALTYEIEVKTGFIIFKVNDDDLELTESMSLDLIIEYEGIYQNTNPISFNFTHCYVSHSEPSVLFDSTNDYVTLKGYFAGLNDSLVQCVYLHQFIVNAQLVDVNTIICDPFGLTYSGNLLISLLINAELSDIEFDILSSVDAKVCSVEEFSDNLKTVINTSDYFIKLDYSNEDGLNDLWVDRCNLECYSSDCLVNFEPSTNGSINFFFSDQYVVFLTISLLNPCCNLPQRMIIKSFDENGAEYQQVMITDFSSLKPTDSFMTDQKDVGIFGFVLDVQTTPFVRFTIDIETSEEPVNISSIVFHGLSVDMPFTITSEKSVLTEYEFSLNNVNLYFGKLTLYNYVGNLLTSFKGSAQAKLNDIVVFQTFDLENFSFQIDTNKDIFYSINDLNINLKSVDDELIEYGQIIQHVSFTNGPAMEISVANDSYSSIILNSNSSGVCEISVNKYNILNETTYATSTVTVLFSDWNCRIPDFGNIMEVFLWNVNNSDCSLLLAVDEAIIVIDLKIQCQIPSNFTINLDSTIEYKTVIDLQIDLLNDNSELVFGTYETLPVLNIKEQNGYFNHLDKNLNFGRTIFKEIYLDFPPASILYFDIEIVHSLFSLNATLQVIATDCEFPKVFSELENDCMCGKGYISTIENNEITCEACGIGYYSNIISADSCFICPNDRTTLETNSTSIDHCICQDGFTFSKDVELCVQCQDDIVCINGTIQGPIDGYWLNRTDLLAFNSSNKITTFKCLNNGCQTKGCSIGYKGKLCQECDEGYIQSSDFSCILEKNSINIYDIFVFVGSFVIFILLNIFSLSQKDKLRKKKDKKIKFICKT
eukprot:TRINITY_DN155_c0_g1_i1.p1 TRINITY_DN155_c0_g1~~TRINITY_DN155_c0_g1_i1.p1  ORF type:complete len:1894 (-),score=440.44 TRINITY_DN155_c0_g1_i1:8-4855(-)